MLNQPIEAESITILPSELYFDHPAVINQSYESRRF